MKLGFWASFLAALANIGSFAFAHGDEALSEATNKLQADPLILWGSVAIGFLVALVISLRTSKFGNIRKTLVFGTIAFVVISLTAQMTISTIVINAISESDGPVHWHADFEIWACNEKQMLMSPESKLNNKVGTGLFHHHDDDRIHIEGPILDLDSVGIDDFFEVIGGHLHQEELEFIDHDGELKVFQNGDLCNDQESKVQVFLLRVTNPEDDNWTYIQTKLEHFDDYTPAPHTAIPPGDCLIIEFDVEKEKTDRLCTSYRIAEEKGALTRGESTSP